MQSTIALINRIKLHYLSAGSGKLLLFLHGFPEFSLAWHKQIDFFSKNYFVVAPDLRGFNLSEKPAHLHDFQMKHFIADIHELMNYCGYNTCIMVGHDIGGSIAQCFAAYYPHCVEKLVLINAAHPMGLSDALDNNREQQKRSAYVNILRDPRAEKMITSYRFAYFWEQLLSEITERQLFSTPMIKAYETAWAIPGAIPAMLNYYRAFPWGIDFSDQKLWTVLTETLIIWGEKDRSLCDDILYGLSAYIPNQSIEKIPEGSHWVVHEASDRVTAYINAFI